MSLKQSPNRKRKSVKATFSADGFSPQEAIAKYLGLSERMLERLRLEGRGPVYRKFGRRVLYEGRDVLAWADAHRRTSTSDSGKAA